MSARVWLALAAVAALDGQQFTPHIGYVYPAGGRQGATFEVRVGGQYLNGVAGVRISGQGVEAKVVEHVRLMTQQQANKLREQLQQEAAKPAGARDQKLIAEIRGKLAGFIRRPANPAIAETVTVRVAIAEGAAAGRRELRLETPLGTTNPLVFYVDRLPEFSKPPSPVTEEPAALELRRSRFQPAYRAPQPPMEVTLPATVNGQVGPGGVDRIRFKASKGQRIVAAVRARDLIPYISDAVPGWFQATLALYNAGGKEIAYADDYRFHPDPVLYCEIPEDGVYTLEIKDAIFRGREDFVYRIAVGELPFLTGVFPLGAKAGSRVDLQLSGWNLPAAKLRQDTRGKQPGVYGVSAGDSNALPFAVDTLAERLEKEPNNQARGAARVKLPVIVNGRIDRPGDWDVFRIDGRAGEEVVAEVTARRLESPLDSILKLTDAAGKQVAVNDDHEDKAAGLLTHHADSFLRATLPRKGSYYLWLGDTQRKGGPEYSYRLRISRPQPDFELRMTPSAISARAGAAALITVHVIRKDGFAGDIALRLKDAPEGFALSGGWAPAGQNSVRLTVAVPPRRPEKPVSLRLEGRATVQGREIRRVAIPAEEMMQAFAYKHLVPAEDCVLRVAGAGRAGPPWKLAEDGPVKLLAGGAATVRVMGPPGRIANQLQLTLNQPPEGIAIQKVAEGRQGLEVVLRAEAGKVKPGLKGNLIVDAAIQRPGAKRPQPAGVLPAIPFEIVP
ncbi:MAG: hypothetical protein ACE15B_04560 [Bryobacteraceae bacterium]